MADCKQCGSPLKANKSFCTVCGAKVKMVTAAPQSMPQAPVAVPAQCSKCGAPVPESKHFCTQCGHPRQPSAPGRANASTGSVSPAGRRSSQSSVAAVNCPGCGAAVPAGKRFCTACGKPVEAKPVEAFLPSPYTPNPPLIEAAQVKAKPVEVKPAEKPAKVKPPGTGTALARRRLWRIALPIAAVVVIAATLFAVYALFIRKPSHLDDKQLLESYYGPPPFFTIILAKDESQSSARTVRREVWVYPERKVSFVFLGGKYQFSSDLQSFGKSVTKMANKLRVEQITESLTVDDLSKLVGSKPVSQSNLPKEELPDAIRYEYGNGINAVFSQGRLLMVRIMPAA